MFGRWIAVIGFAAIFVACSSSLPKAELATHSDSSRNIPKIDNMIVSMKQSYISQCYEPILKRNPPDNQCQTDLFQMLERSYHLDYNQNHVAMASNKLLFKDIDAKIIEMSRNDPEVRNAIRAGAFTSTSEMLSYYHEKYHFDTHLEQY